MLSKIAQNDMKLINIYRRLAMLVLVLGYVCTGASASDRFYAEPVNIEPGESGTLVFILENEQKYFGFQADIQLPAGLEMVQINGKANISLSPRAGDSYIVVNNILADGRLRIGTFSTTHASFEGDKGALMYLPVRATSDFSGGMLTVSNVLFTGADDCDVRLSDSEVAIGAQHYNRFYIPDITIAVGQTVTAGLVLDNETTFTAFQTDMYLPEGLNVDETSFRLTGRGVDGHTLSAKSSGDGRVRIVCMSAPGSEFSGKSGLLVEFDIIATEGVAENCMIELKNQIFSTISAKEYYLPNELTNVTTEYAKVTGIELDFSSFDMFIGETVTLCPTVCPSYAYEQTVEWSSSNPEVATVSAEGVVTALTAGTAYITVTATDGSGISASCKVTINPVLATSLTLSQESWSGKVGENIVLTATVFPDNTTDKTVVWSSSDETVATVDADGNVASLAVGEAEITATVKNGVSAVCRVTVKPVLAESLTFSPESWNGVEGESFRITAVVKPDNTTDKTLAWSSSDESVATVDQEGIVTIMRTGICTITAKVTDGSGVEATCKIDIATGLYSLETDKGNYSLVYDLSGLLVGEGLEKNILKMLAPGIYFVRNGKDVKKVSVK